jgi:hypothetical protein
MDAKVGDEIVVDALHTGEPAREGEVLEILTSGGVVHYRVRWDDGHEAIFYPGSTTHIVRTAKR